MKPYAGPPLAIFEDQKDRVHEFAEKHFREQNLRFVPDFFGSGLPHCGHGLILRRLLPAHSR